MSIPIDRLYHYIESVAKEIYKDDILIYRFYPHGSKKLEDLVPLRNFSLVNGFTSPQVYCNDQEPLAYEYYKNVRPISPFKQSMSRCGITYPERNFLKCETIYDKCLLLHSEQRSNNLESYEHNRYIGVYYWSHAIIALDWFRYAQHETITKNTTKIFLVYNRAWSGTREYRLKLIDLLIQFNLLDVCQISVNPIEPELGIHYTEHQFNNRTWAPTHKLEDYVPSKEVLSSASADYEIIDYNATEFELVLETLFDDRRLHLTEKILRPIAVGQPFLLAATHGSLEYLRSYGFKTFNGIIDETYDTIEDPLVRLEAIVKAMAEITSWSDQERTEKLVLARQIADYNRQHFFSDNFIHQVTAELKTNLAKAFTELEETNTSQGFITHRKKSVKFLELKETVLAKMPNRQDAIKVLAKARYYYNKLQQ